MEKDLIIFLENIYTSNLLKLFDARGLTSIQMAFYNYFYKNNSDRFDWIMFIDFDEYINFRENNNLESYLYHKRFEKCQSILLNWIIYDDNDLIKYDKRPLIERFTRQKKETNIGKAIVRGGINNLLIPTSMNPGINIKYFCNSNGKRIFPNDFFYRKFENNSLAYIKHFYTKTAEEFCNKINKGDIHYNIDNILYKAIQNEKIKEFYRINKPNEEKIKILNKCINI